jgi:Interleukin-like EMT inducer
MRPCEGLLHTHSRLDWLAAQLLTSTCLLLTTASFKYITLTLHQQNSGSAGYARLVVRGQDYSLRSAGLNVVVLDADHRVTAARAFATHDCTSASERLCDFIHSLEKGAIVMVAAQGTQHYPSERLAVFAGLAAHATSFTTQSCYCVL